jgi:hypothetical protein
MFLQRIGVEGARALSSVISQDKCAIESLSIGRNGLGNEGLQVLCNGLRCCSRLKALDISCNSLGDAAVDSISALLSSRCCALQALDVTTNKFTRPGVDMLSKAIMANTSLRLLCLDDLEESDLCTLRHCMSTTHALEPASSARKLAFCMALHPRLGHDSPASLLNAESCECVLDMCKVDVPRRLQTEPAHNLFALIEST